MARAEVRDAAFGVVRSMIAAAILQVLLTRNCQWCNAVISKQHDHCPICNNYDP